LAQTAPKFSAILYDNFMYVLGFLYGKAGASINSAPASLNISFFS